jgi:hypothetical protein
MMKTSISVMGIGHVWLTLAGILISTGILIPIGITAAQAAPPEWRGLLASPYAANHAEAMKAVYFFPGERGANDWLYTTHPLEPRDGQWNSDPSTRRWVMQRMVQAHINTVVMSYWSNMPQWSPMDIGPTTLPLPRPAEVGVLDAVEGMPLVVMPAIEGGSDWEFAKEFPYRPGDHQVAPGLVERIGQLVELFRGRMHLWASMYDRHGHARYAVHLLHVSSDVIDQVNGRDDDDRQFAQAFDAVATEVSTRYKISVGFTLDTIGGGRYSAYPGEAGQALEKTPSVLAVQGFASEVFSDRVKNGPRCLADDWRQCQPHDNNLDNLQALADWKRAALSDWLKTNVPVILDVSNGFDGRIVWHKAENGAGFWGDNLTYTDDRWRNWMSQLKGLVVDGSRIKGITFNTWNGYTEGYAAVPSVEHGTTVYNWLTDLLEPPPWDCNHMHYVNGARTHRVYGAICEKWVQLGADRGFGAPVSEELPTARGRMSFFTDGKAIYWSGATRAHEVHGLIAQTYYQDNADRSCLGLPVTDEEHNGSARVSRFERGRIDWHPGDIRGRITCT